MCRISTDRASLFFYAMEKVDGRRGAVTIRSLYESTVCTNVVRLCAVQGRALAPKRRSAHVSLAVVQSRALLGLDAAPVTVEVHLANGLPSFTLVGLADVEVKEARERVRSALQG